MGALFSFMIWAVKSSYKWVEVSFEHIDSCKGLLYQLSYRHASSVICLWLCSIL